MSKRSELNRNDSRNTFRESERQGILPHLNVEKQRNGSTREIEKYCKTDITDAVSSIQYSEFDAYRSVKSDDADKPDGFVSNQFSLVLEGDTALKMYYVFDAGYDPFSYQYYIDGEAAVLHKDGSKYYLVVENIVAKKLDIAHEFTISDGNKSYSIISSALSYARSLAGLSDTNKQNLGKAILLYNRMAKDYFNSLSN